jgi:hypothetical protein
MKQLLLIWVVVLAIIGIGIFGWLVSESQKLNTETRNDHQEIAETVSENELKPPESSTTNLSPLSVENLSATEKHVHFAEVSFTYDASLFSAVTADIVPAHPLERADDKPMGFNQKHIRFCFPNEEPYKYAYPDCYPYVVVFSLADFKQAFSISDESVKGIEKEIADVKKIISSKSTSVKGKIPYFEYFDASQVFHSHVKYIKFQNGKGMLFLTYYDVELNNVDSDNLAYLFQGITDDGKYGVLTWFPVAALNFPKDTYQPPTSYNENSNVNAILRKYEAYRLWVQRQCSALSPDEYKPSLRLLEKLVRSIRVEKIIDK